MKKIIFIILIVTTSLTFGQINNYKMDSVHDFVQGDSIGNIEPFEDTHDMNPSSYYFDDNGFFYLADSIYRRIIKYDKDFNYLEHYKKMESSMFDRIEIKNNLVIASENKHFLIENFNGENIFHLYIGKLSKDLKMKNFNDFYTYVNNKIVLTTLHGEVYLINNPQDITEKNEMILIDDEDNNQDSIIDVLDYKKLSSFLVFKKKIPQTNNNGKNINNIKIRCETTAEFLGFDNDGNYYWNDSYKSILIFNNKYEFLDAFYFDIPNSQIKPVIHPSGDVYFMDISYERAKLLRVKRVW